jgi:hypothetical protein
MKERFIKSMENPHEMELLYHENADEFLSVFNEIYAEQSDNPALKIWKERLFYTPPQKNKLKLSKHEALKQILLVCILIAVGGLLAKVPVLFPNLYPNYVDEELYILRNVTAFFLPGVAILYLVLHGKFSKKTFWTSIGIIVIGCVYINLLPNYVFPGKISSMSDTLILACIHIPFVYWFAGGIAWIKFDYKNLEKRLEFLKMNGELLLTAILILLVGVVLSVLTVFLFDLINIDVSDLFFEWISIFGAIGCSFVAVVLTLTRKMKMNLFAILAKIFAPLVTVIVLTFLVMMMLNIRNPFEDRDFLITINVLLFFIVTVGTYVIIHRDSSRKDFIDYIVSILLSSGFIIGLVAVIAVSLRLFQDGFTPNRIALIGINILLMVNIGGILFHEIKWLIKKTKKPATTTWIAKYLPVYFAWVAFMVFIYPWLCGLR